MYKYKKIFHVMISFIIICCLLTPSVAWAAGIDEPAATASQTSGEPSASPSASVAAAATPTASPESPAPSASEDASTAPFASPESSAPSASAAALASPSASASAAARGNSGSDSVEDYLNSLTPEQKQQILDQHKKGLIVDNNLPRQTSATTLKLMKSGNYPSSYDLRSLGRVTSVKDQGTSGCCWAFAATSSLESCLLPGETDDFSENNLKNNSGYNLNPNTGGGNDVMATAYYARWAGPVKESDDPYNQSSTSSTSAGPVQKHVQDVIWLDTRSGPMDNDEIKNAIMNYGAVDIDMYMDNGNNEFAVPENGHYSYYTSVADTVDHDVTVVGWDDNFPSSYFKDYDHNNAVPAGNGAFIVKNSWGTSWGDNGYFYVSYYDANFGMANGNNPAVFYNAESAGNYSSVYQYDPLGVTGYYSNVSWMANVFTAATSTNVSAVSFYSLQNPTSYNIYIVNNYTGSSSMSSNRGSPVASGTIYNMGYFTVRLNTPVPITAGKKFAVIVQLTTPGDAAVEGYTPSTMAATASQGQSYLGNSGGTYWYDIYSASTLSNLCIKAFTTMPTITSISPAKGTLTGGTSVAINGYGFTGATSVKFGSKTATSFTVNSDTSITAVSPSGTGTVDITVTGPPGTSTTGTPDQFTYTHMYAVNIATLSGGSITPDHSSAAAGDTVNLTITPNAGEQVQAGSLKYNNGSDHAITGTSFTMPSTDVTVSAVFELSPIGNFVTRFYELCLSREPDPTGLGDWVTALQSGQLSGADTAKGFVFSDEFQSKNLSNTDFVGVMYNAFFGRGPDSTGQAAWVNLLDLGFSRYYVMAGFVNSDEFKSICSSYGISVGSLQMTDPADKYPNITSFVARFYQLCLGRGADPTGLNSWVGALQTGQDKGSDVAYGFVFSNEFISRNVSNSDFVTIMYKAFFNRDPDPSGYNAWLNMLNSGTSRLHVLAGFVGSQEFISLCSSYGINPGYLKA